MTYDGPPARGRQQGFTLFEVLIVALLIGLSALMIIPSIAPTDHARRVRQEAQRFGIILDALQQESILTFQNFVLQVYRDRYQVLVLDTATGPQPLEDKLFRVRQLPDDMYFKANADNEFISLNQFIKKPETEDGVPAEAEEEEKDKPELNILIYASGEKSPFSLQLISDSGTEFEITGQIAGTVVIADKHES